MNKISVHNRTGCSFTAVPNLFIDHFLPRANGEYVKLYLCLLRHTASGEGLSLEELADTLEYTDRDVRLGLSYWEKEGLLSVAREQGQICGVSLLPVNVPDAAIPQANAAMQEAAAATAAPVQKLAASVPAASDPIQKLAASASTPVQKPIPEKSLTQGRIQELSQKEDLKVLIYVAEKYIGRPMTPTEIQNILYFFDELHFSIDLIEYLVEYCVTKGSCSTHYMEKVALEWYKDGITTVREAKANTNLYHRTYYQVMNFFGIKGRGPTQPEITCIDRWVNTWHFTMDIIHEACNRTIIQTQKPSFQYADKILSQWHDAGIHHLSDIQPLDEAHTQKKKRKAAPEPRSASGTKFNNFQQRDYDFDELERQIAES